MGRLAGFRYREIVRKLKARGFEFDRQAAGSHEIWFNSSTNRYTTVPNHPGDMPEGTLRAILKQAETTRMISYGLEVPYWFSVNLTLAVRRPRHLRTE